MQQFEAKVKELGVGFVVRRALPRAGCRQLGPWVFLDEMGPKDLEPEELVVPPHPHIGLATVTYLFDGRIVHRDSLGNHQAIEPGAINLMTAGRGIVHSERSEDHVGRLHGLQLWLALPASREDMEPAFEHTPAAALPVVERGSSRVVVALGAWLGARSPVSTYGPTLFADVQVRGRLHLPREHEELGLYVVAGEVRIQDTPVRPGSLAVLGDGPLRLEGDGHLVVVGGTSVGERRMSWNFVHSDADRIQTARRDWSAGRFPEVPGDGGPPVPLP